MRSRTLGEILAIWEHHFLGPTTGLCFGPTHTYWFAFRDESGRTRMLYLAA